MVVSDLSARRRDFRGELLGPDDPGYDEARRIYNGAIDRRPAVIARCMDADDVAASIGLAREFDMPLAVRAGGHGVAGHAICQGGVVVDLTRMRRVEVDPERLVVHVEGGARLMDLDAACAPYGLVTPAGVVGTTGVAGLTLGGGIGHLLGPLGFTCDSLVGAEVVTSDGSRVRTSAEEEAELLWGLRGAGGNFGVVTRFDFRLHPLETPYAGVLRYGRDGVVQAIKTMRALTDDAPTGLSAQLFAAKEGEGVLAELFVCHVGEHADGAAVTRPLLEIPGVSGEVGPLSFLELQALSGDPPWGIRNYWKGYFVRELPDDVVEELVARWLDSPVSALLFESIHGVGTRLADDACAFAARRARFNVTVTARWEDPTADEAVIAAARDLAALLEPWSLGGGGYLNYSGDAEPEARLRAAFGEEKFERLRVLKRRFDPANVFRLNQNVPPD
jgi:FAD/FMN-containing dehydrogenase